MVQHELMMRRLSQLAVAADCLCTCNVGLYCGVDAVVSATLLDTVCCNRHSLTDCALQYISVTMQETL